MLLTGYVAILLLVLSVAHCSLKLSIAGIVDTVSSLFSKPKKSEHSVLMKRLHELGESRDQLANTVLALMVGASVELSLSMYMLSTMLHCY